MDIKEQISMDVKGFLASKSVYIWIPTLWDS